MEELAIKGLFVKKLERHSDHRGCLLETFRIDELEEDVRPAMSYVTFTKPGCHRGPHEHKKRVELFAFPGPGNQRLIVWDNRPESPTYKKRVILFAGEDNPKLVVIYPGLVHVIDNVSKDTDAMLINYPTTLFMGWGRKEEFVDEVRYEDDDSVFWKEFREIRG